MCVTHTQTQACAQSISPIYWPQLSVTYKAGSRLEATYAYKCLCVNVKIYAKVPRCTNVSVSPRKPTLSCVNQRSNLSERKTKTHAAASASLQTFMKDSSNHFTFPRLALYANGKRNRKKRGCARVCAGINASVKPVFTWHAWALQGVGKCHANLRHAVAFQQRVS